MSGICGIYNLDGAPVCPDLLHKMAECAAHRGPDGIHYWIEGNIGLAHLALHVTPESVREKFPFLNRGGEVCLTADARVDNRPELIEILTAKGYLLDKDSTDADLILAAYECWGADCPVHIIGDFAFAIWDARERRLLCVRDARGVKPFHYSRLNRTLCFASEVGQVIEHPGVPRRLDEMAIADHLAKYFYDEESTMFRDVRRLPPAHRLITSATGIRLERYWDVDPSACTRYRRDEQYAEQFLEIFRRAVGDRLRTRTKAVGVAMSGGLDSCSIAAVAQKMLSGRGGSPRLVAYSFAFDKLKECDERAYSRVMADELGVEIEYIPAEEFWFLREPLDFRPSLETPLLWFELVIRHMLRLLQARGGRVILTGEGGDSLLQGTPLSYADRLLRGDTGVLRELIRVAREKGRPYLCLLYAYLARPLTPDILIRGLRRLAGRNKQSLIPEWICPDFARKTSLAERLASPPAPRLFRSPARQYFYEHAVILGNEGRGIYWYDNAAARFASDARHPFVDLRLLEFVWSIPSEQLYRAGRRRALHRQAMAGTLPEIIRQRPDKTAFGRFVGFTLNQKEEQQVRKLLETPLLSKMGIVHAEKLRAVYEDYRTSGDNTLCGALFNIITLELWLRKYYIVGDVGLCPGAGGMILSCRRPSEAASVSVV